MPKLMAKEKKRKCGVFFCPSPDTLPKYVFGLQENMSSTSVDNKQSHGEKIDRHQIRLQKRTVLSDEEEEEIPKARTKKRKSVTGEETREEKSLRAMMDVDDSMILRDSHMQASHSARFRGGITGF